MSPQAVKGRKATSATASPVCCTGGLVCFFRNIFRSDVAVSAKEDSKLDELVAKIDSLASQIKANAPEVLDAVSAKKLLEEAERDGIEVARYSQLPQFSASILDTFIPRYQRLTQLHFGAIVSNPHAPMAFKEKMGYNMTYNMVPPGNGNALHMHRSIEIFIALDGRWEIAWGMQGEHSVVLQPWDFVCCPARVCHSYKNIEEDTAQNIMTILPGKSWIAWAPNVVGEARRHGAECDDNGMLLKYAHLMAATNNGGLASAASTVQWKSMGPRDMDPYVHRFSEQKPFECRMHEALDEDGNAPFIEMFWKKVQPEGNLRLPTHTGVDLLLVILEGTVLVKTGRGRAFASAGRLDAVRIPAQGAEDEDDDTCRQVSDQIDRTNTTGSDKSHDVVIHNPCPTESIILVTATQMREQNDLFFHLC